MPTEPDDDENEHEGADDFGDQIPAMAADSGSGGENAELRGRVGFVVEVLFVGDPREDSAEKSSDELRSDVDHRRDDGDWYAAAERGGAARDKTKRHRRVQVRAGAVRDDHASVHSQAPAKIDHEKTAMDALGLCQRDVGDHTATEEHEKRGAHQLRQEISAEIVHVDVATTARGNVRVKVLPTFGVETNPAASCTVLTYFGLPPHGKFAPGHPAMV